MANVKCLKFVETGEPMEYCCELTEKLFYFISIKCVVPHEFEIVFGLVDLDEFTEEEERKAIILEYYPSIDAFRNLYKNKCAQALAECLFDKEKATYPKVKKLKIKEAKMFVTDKMAEVLDPHSRYMRWAGSTPAKETPQQPQCYIQMSLWDMLDIS